MKEAYPSRIERLATKVGGRFRLTVTIQKRFQQVLRGGRAFAPSENTNVLFGLVLDEVEDGMLKLIASELTQPQVEAPAES